MANANAATTVWNSPNYVGELYLIGANQTPFLSMMGGLSNGIARTVAAWEFSVAQPWALEAAAQPAITETASLTAPTPWTYVREQDKNVCQIFQKQISVSYAKESNRGTISGIAVVNGEVQPVQSELDFQTQGALAQLAVDAEVTFLEGTYNLAGNAGQANKTRGIMSAIATNTVAAGAADLTKDMINELLRNMAGNGAQLRDMHLFCGAFNIDRLQAIYGYAPEDRSVGGTNITKIITPFCEITPHFTPKITNTTVGLFDMSVCQPVFLPVPGKGVLFREELSKAGAATSYQLYGQMGLDYGPEEFHGKITGTTNS